MLAHILKKGFQLCFFSVFLFSDLWGQEMPQVIPPAPEAASLGKYTDMPVNYSSGLPQIGIPMFTATSRDISVPVSLTYHAGGIKVEEIASRVGLGWNLQAGGSVTRSVRGIADDGLNGWLSPNHTVTDFENAPHSIGPQSKYALMNAALSLDNDYEPDVFTFSYPGGGGKFFFSQSGDIITLPKTEHKIERFMGATGIDRFVITTPSGYKYHFGFYSGITARETSSVDMSFTDSSSGSGIPIPGDKTFTHFTTWHLVAIESPVSDAKVTFQYTSQTTSVVNRLSQSRMVNTSGGCTPLDMRTSYVHSTNTEMALSSIQFENGTVQFEYDTADRLDLPGSKALKKVKLSSSGVLKSFELEHDYFTSTGLVVSPIPGVSSDHYRKRLYLNRVIEKGESGLEPKVYDLTYETSVQLPQRLSYAQDAWGFYNGKTNNSNLIPERFKQHFTVHPTTGSNNFYLVVEGADRRANPATTQANMLTRITYPTGGSTEFAYEANGAYLSGAATQVANTYFEAEKQAKVNYSYNLGPGVPTNFEQTFSVSQDDLSGTLHFTFSTTGCPQQPLTGGIPDCGISVMLQGVTDPGYSRSLSLIDDVYFNVAAGDYKLIINVINNDPPNQVTAATATLSSFQNASGYADRSEFNVGGVRILRTTQHDNLGQKITREYGYVNDQLNASGFLQDNVWTFFEEGVPYCSVGFSAADLYSSHSSSVNMGSGAGHIGYTAVREAVLDNSLVLGRYSGTNYPNGYTEYRYDWALNQPNNDSFSFPYPPFKQLDWKRGNMLSRSVFRQSTPSPFKQLEESNNYEYAQSTDPFYESVKAVKIDQRGYIKLWAYYDVVSSNNHVLSSTSTTVEASGTITETTDYEYNNHYLRPDKTTITHSDGQKTITTTKYTDDTFGSELNSAEKTVLSTMAAANILRPVLTETFINTVSTPDSKSLTVFGDLTGGYLPVTLRIWNRQNSNYEDRLTYNYTQKGNYELLTKDDHQRVAYIWDYGGALPIAQVGNVSNTNDMAYSSFESTGKGGWTYTGSTTTAANLPTGEKFYNLSGSSITKSNLTSGKRYIVSFWAKDGVPSVSHVVSSNDAANPNTFGWKYYEKVVTGTTTVTVSGTAKVDELGLYPVGSQMTTYTYEPLRGITSQTTPNGITTYYEYDVHGRLKYVRDQDRNILKVNEYVYQANAGTTGN